MTVTWKSILADALAASAPRHPPLKTVVVVIIIVAAIIIIIIIIFSSRYGVYTYIE